MRMTVGQLREIVRHAIAGSQPSEAYSMELMDDPAFAEKSLYIGDDVKEKIRIWAKAMKLSS